MGMFDEIKCEYIIPGAPEEIQIGSFQTQDFDCAMDNYTITSAGRLILHECEWDYVPDEERPYYGKPEWDTTPIFRIFGCLKRKSLGDRDINYHGILNMYTTFSKHNNNWYEYNIKFTNGTIESVEKVEDNG